MERVGNKISIMSPEFPKDKPSGIRIGIHSNAEPDAGLTDGHAWISIEDTSTGRSQTFGLWPDDHPRTVDNGDGTDVRKGMEDGAVAVASQYEDVPLERLENLVEFIATPDEWGYSHTCADWARDAFQAGTGIYIDVDDYLGVETPRELTESIRENEKKK